MSAPMRDPHRRQAITTGACVLALLAVTAWFWSLHKGNAAGATLLATLGCLGIVLPPRERMAVLPRRVRALPRSLDPVPFLATLLSSPGYGLNWFYGENPYDEVVHLLSGIMAGAVFAALLLADGRAWGGRRLLWLGLLFGLVLGSGWEVFEWATHLIGDATDTWTDIVLTASGAAIGAVAWGARSAHDPALRTPPATPLAVPAE
ncbi:hypothetical protein ACE7GA_07280 [Roseomonas sp. CCTCC AB2023176]|uniref:hypothetical protein n=1 Tax=Roseomonas sp. CCTCC AB2023176 TaxID=3342640 RepID=UPI0035DDEEFF